MYKVNKVNRKTMTNKGSESIEFLLFRTGVFQPTHQFEHLKVFVMKSCDDHGIVEFLTRNGKEGIYCSKTIVDMNKWDRIDDNFTFIPRNLKNVCVRVLVCLSRNVTRQIKQSLPPSGGVKSQSLSGCDAFYLSSKIRQTRDSTNSKAACCVCRQQVVCL